MSATIAVPRLRPAPRARRRFHQLFPNIVFGLIIAGLGFAIAVSAFETAQAVLADGRQNPVPVVEYPARPLPAEWQWNGKPLVDVDHMFMHRQQNSRGPDWIRNGRAR